ncbi:hypothetical protein ATK30_0565 [Amycolatopsis echigonensis]|uniref:Uncharacterized protein n=1 Tax=Amycolatopsis echigonensis TaxID=2576905 RepID=A0A2N3X0D7_9PSEU|nr:hypothetical protein [Amycolatopsis niigatensis]PKV99585.1 hypothetical protein ATK30_0565 [Amycolatopsis niigatensis]
MNPTNPDDLFAPATDAERRTWQLRAHAALAIVLSRAAAAGLDPVTWTLTDLGGLYGRINEYGRVLTEDQARERFAQWVEFLALSTNPRSARPESAALRAVGSLAARDGGSVVVVLSAFLPDHHDPDGLHPAGEEC